jgi:serine/threonine-protein kinase HipA
LALADTEPDAWGRRVIARAHAKARAQDARLGPLTELDYLAAFLPAFEHAAMQEAQAAL